MLLVRMYFFLFLLTIDADASKVEARKKKDAFKMGGKKILLTCARLLILYVNKDILCYILFKAP